MPAEEVFGEIAAATFIASADLPAAVGPAIMCTDGLSCDASGSVITPQLLPNICSICSNENVSAVGRPCGQTCGY